MSKASDALAKLIDDQIKKQREKMDLKVDKAIALYKSGNEKADEVVEKVETDIETAKDAKEKVSDAIDRIKSVRLSFDSGRKAAETTEKASTIGSALNPAAAAIAYAQKFIIDKLKIEVRTKLEKIEKLGDLEYDEDCDYCMKNPFTLDAIETKKLVELDKDRVKEHLNKVDDITTNIKELYHTRERKSDLDDTINKLQKVSTLINETNSSKVLLDEKRKNVLHQLTSIEEKIVKYYEQENDIMFNQQIENEINTVESELDDVNNSLDMVTDNTNNIFG